MGFQPADDFIFESNGTFIRDERTGYEIEKRGFAGPVWPDHADDLGF